MWYGLGDTWQLAGGVTCGQDRLHNLGAQRKMKWQALCSKRTQKRKAATAEH